MELFVKTHIFAIKPNFEDTEKVLGDILKKDLDIPDVLGKVSEDAEREYKEARYKWQHVIIRAIHQLRAGSAKSIHRILT